MASPKGTSGMPTTDLYSGLKRNNPAGDSGMRPGSGRVDANPTRTGPASSPSSLGPRQA